MREYQRDNFARAHIDPTAGVALMPQIEKCPRCGLGKGVKGHARPGLCVDCSIVVGLDRVRWAS